MACPYKVNAGTSLKLPEWGRENGVTILHAFNKHQTLRLEMASLEDAAKFDSEPYFFLEGRAYAAQPWDSSFDPYLCQKCGKPGHKEHGCLQEPHCWFCARGDHRKDHCPYLVNGDGRTGARCPNCGGDHPTWAFNKCRSEALAKHKHDCYVKSLSGPYWLPLTYTNGDGTW